MTTLDELYKKAEQLNTELEATRSEIAWKQSQIRAEVSFTKIGDAYVMQHNDRTIKVRPNAPFGRWRITEGRKVLVKESMHNLQKIRLDFALGRI